MNEPRGRGCVFGTSSLFISKEGEDCLDKDESSPFGVWVHPSRPPLHGDSEISQSYQ